MSDEPHPGDQQESTSATSSEKKRMNPAFIAIGLFVVAVIVMAFLSKGNTMEKIPLEDGETVLWEEMGVTTTQFGHGRPVVYKNVLLRVTDRRLIMGVKALAGGHPVNYVVHYKGDVNRQSKLHVSYCELALDPADFSFVEHEGVEVMVFPMKGITLAGSQKVRLQSSKLDELKKLVH